MPVRKPSRQSLLRIGGSLLASVLAGDAYVRYIEPNWVDINHLQLLLPRLPRSFDGYRIAQLSDIHMDGKIARERLKYAVRVINEQDPDLVVVTGDFVTRSPQSFETDLVSSLSALKPGDATVAVLGNHDHLSDPAMVRRIIRRSNIIELSNDVYTLSRGGEELHIAGVDDYVVHQDRFDLVLDRLPSEGAAILLAHEPDFACISAATERFDLQFSGHSHGGQVRLPFIGAPRLPKYGMKYPIGLYHVNGMMLYTNRGLGLLPPHVRFDCRPEITVITLRMTYSQGHND